MPNTQHTQLNDRLNASLESHINQSDIGEGLKNADPLQAELITNHLVQNAHTAGAIRSGLIDPSNVPGGAAIVQHAEKNFPKAVQLCKNLYDLRKKGVPDQEIQRQLHADLIASHSPAGASNLAAGIMAEIANKHGQNKKVTGSSAIEVMQGIARKNRGV